MKPNKGQNIVDNIIFFQTKISSVPYFLNEKNHYVKKIQYNTKLNNVIQYNSVTLIVLRKHNFKKKISYWFVLLKTSLGVHTYLKGCIIWIRKVFRLFPVYIYMMQLYNSSYRVQYTALYSLSAIRGIRSVGYTECMDAREHKNIGLVIRL